MQIWRTAIALGFSLSLLLTACIPPPPPPTTEVKITCPADFDQVDVTEMARGTSQLVPDGHVIWVVLFPQITGRYYPQNDPAVIEATGNWSSSVCIGVEGDVGLKFDILAVVADEAAQSSFRAYLADAKDRKDWPGLERLPEGATVYHRITVTRK